MYSPGALKVTFVVVLPPSLVSIVGLALSNFGAAGPRIQLHVTASGGLKNPRPRPAGSAPAAPARPPGSVAAAPRPRPRAGSGMLIFGPSSVAHNVSGSGVPTVAVYFAAMPTGAPVTVGPFGSNFSFGGVFLFAASSYGSTM